MNLTRISLFSRARLPMVAVAIVTAAGVAACGSSGSGNGSGGSSSKAPAVTSAARAEAQKLIAPYTGHPGPFPVTDALKKLPPKGGRVAIVNDGTELVTLLYQLMQPAAKTLGLNLYMVQAGSSATGVANAFQTIVQQKPAAVINAAVQPSLWKPQLKQLEQEHVPVVSLGTATQGLGLVEPNGAPSFAKEGQLQAAWIVANAKQTPNVVYYDEPELAYTSAAEGAFQSEMHHLCPSCTVRVVNIPLATVNNTAPAKIVSDLQAHPDTNYGVLESSDILGGVPAALKAAGLKVNMVGANGIPATYQYLKSGYETVDLSADLPVLAWTAVDSAARLIEKQPLDSTEQDKAALVTQFLTASDLSPTIMKEGWTGYPDVAQRFEKLWGISS